MQGVLESVSDQFSYYPKNANVRAARLIKYSTWPDLVSILPEPCRRFLDDHLGVVRVFVENDHEYDLGESGWVRMNDGDWLIVSYSKAGVPQCSVLSDAEFRARYVEAP